MTKLLKLKDYIILTAGLFGDITDEIRFVGNLVPAIMQARYTFVPSNYKKSSYVTSISQMLTTGNIDKKVDKHGKPYIILTTSGKKQFRRNFPLLTMQAKKWDGNFMIVIFDIPEKQRVERDRLRRKLKELGFGMLQKSVWISPYHFETDMNEFIHSNKLNKYVSVLTAKKLWINNLKDFSRKIWKLRKIKSSYLKILKNPGISFKKSLNLYIETLIQDPLLPNELLPDDWPRKKVLSLISRRRSTI